MHDNPWDDAQTVTDDDVAGWVELDASGFDALIGWVAGPGRLRRVPDDPARYAVQVTYEEPGSTRTWTEPRTAADQAGIEADIDAYLTDAGAPPRPGGYRWFLQPPAGVGERDLEAAVNKGIDRMAPAATHPSQLVEPIRRVLADLYGR
jgi:hypothetical protein